MIFEALSISGAFLIKPESYQDSRGSFTRTFCVDEFKKRGLQGDFVQQSLSYNCKKGTFRGMHFQRSPKEEIKLVRCTRGAAIDIILDLRPGSETYKQHVMVEITAENKKAVYIPRGCAHGFITLQDDTELFYSIDQFFDSQLAAGVRWNDPSFKISLPESITVIAAKDLEFPPYV